MADAWAEFKMDAAPVPDSRLPVVRQDGDGTATQITDPATGKKIWRIGQTEPAAPASEPVGDPWAEFSMDSAPVKTVDLPPSSAAQDNRPTSFLQGVTEGLAIPANNLGDVAEWGMDKIGLGGVPDAVNKFGADYLGLPASSDAAKATQQAASDASPTQGSGLGRFVGEVAGTLPTMAIPGGVLAQGAASGALLTDKRDPAGIALDAGIGAAGGFVGDRAMRAAGAAISPVVAPAVQRLLDAGIPLTPGQIVGQGGVVGRAVKTIEDSLANFPIVGNAVRGARTRADEALNRAATNRALHPIGDALPDNIAVGHDAVTYAGNQLSNAYNDVLPRLNGTVDQTFATRLQVVRARANLPPEYNAMLDQAQREAGNAFTGAGQNGQYSGRTLRDASERLRDIASAWQRSDDPYQRIVGDTAEQMRQQLHALARRQNPRYATRLRDIDRGYASLVRVERAAAGTDDGIFTARQYKTATRQSDQSVRKRQSARGQALDQDLSSAASQVMPSNVGAGGSTAVNSLGMLGALGIGAFGGQPAAVGTLGALGAGSLAYTPVGQRVMQSVLAGRQGAGARSLANMARLYAPGAGLVIPPLLLDHGK